MDADDWKFELQRLYEMFERESTISLRKVHRCFGVLGRPFGDEFRRYFLKLSIIRLDSSFDAVLMGHQFDNLMEMPSTSHDQVDSDKIANNLNIQSSANVDFWNTPLNGSLLELKSEKSDDAPIEISDSDDDSVQAEEHVENGEVNIVIDIPLESNAPQPTEETNGNRDGVRPNLASVHSSMDGQIQAKASLGGQNKAKHTDGKRITCKDCTYTSNDKSNLRRHQLIHKSAKPFRCDHCDYAARRRDHLIMHQQRTHVQQKLMGIARNPNDSLFKCTYCDQRFTKWHSLKGHLKKSHKDNQCLFNCGRCMLRFIQKFERDRHEALCTNHRYECHLCKTYVANDLNSMQLHMQTHSEAKPFECAVCNQRFRHTWILRRHLNSVHSLISA